MNAVEAIFKEIEALSKALEAWDKLSRIFNAIRKLLPILSKLTDMITDYQVGIKSGNLDPTIMSPKDIGAFVDSGTKDLQDAYTGLLTLENLHDDAPNLLEPAVKV